MSNLQSGAQHFITIDEPSSSNPCPQRHHDRWRAIVILLPILSFAITIAWAPSAWADSPRPQCLKAGIQTPQSPADWENCRPGPKKAEPQPVQTHWWDIFRPSRPRPQPQCLKAGIQIPQSPADWEPCNSNKK
jgi:hypothetical protein